MIEPLELNLESLESDEIAEIAATAKNLSEYGSRFLQLGEHDQALFCQLKALAIHDALCPLEAERPLLAARRSVTRVLVGDIHKDRGKLRETRLWYESALRIDEDLAAKHPDSDHFQDNLSWSYSRLARLSMVEWDFETGRRLAALHLAIMRRLVDRQPRNCVRMHGLVDSLDLEIIFASRDNDLESIERLVAEMNTVTDRMLSIEPENAAWISDRQLAANHAAKRLELATHGIEKNALLDEALRQAEDQLRQAPISMAAVFDVAWAHHKIAEKSLADGHWEVSRLASLRSIEFADRCTRFSPETVGFMSLNSLCLEMLARAEHALDSNAAATGHAQAAAEILADAYRRRPTIDTALRLARIHLGPIEVTPDRFAEALKWAARAVDDFDAHGSPNPEIILARALWRNGRIEAAHRILSRLRSSDGVGPIKEIESLLAEMMR